jgi:hypothetical protein
MWEAFGREMDCWREDCWRKMNCWRESAKGELLASMRAKTLRKLKRGHGTVQVCTENLIHRL